jgi:hypothetical protein
MPQAQPLPTEQLGSLVATAQAELPTSTRPVSDTTQADMEIKSVRAIPLTGIGAGSVALFSTGFRRFDPVQNHFIVMYTPEGTGWHEVSRIELESPDFVDPQSVEQVAISSDRVWLTVASGVGAHSSCFTVVSVKAGTLKQEAESCSSSGGAGSVRDLDGDGAPEVLFDSTDYYVTCYACGLRLFNTTTMRWDGARFQELQFTELPGDDSLATLNNQAVRFAKANRWKETLPLVARLRSQGQQNQIARTNATLIELRLLPFADQAENSSFTPLIPQLFYGDYSAALAYLRAKPAEELFDVETSQVFGPEVQGFEANIPKYITTTVEPALALDPNFAAGHFFRGWALALADQHDPQALREIEQAATLDPNEALYSACIAYLKQR